MIVKIYSTDTRSMHMLAKFHSFFKNANEFKFYALIKHAWKQSKTDRRLTDPLTLTDSRIE